MGSDDIERDSAARHTARHDTLDYRGPVPVPVEEVVDREALPGLGLDRSPFWKGVARWCGRIFWWSACVVGVCFIAAVVRFLWRNSGALFR